jgi:hypothetical protein
MYTYIPNTYGLASIYTLALENGKFIFSRQRKESF